MKDEGLKQFEAFWYFSRKSLRPTSKEKKYNHSSWTIHQSCLMPAVNEEWNVRNHYRCTISSSHLQIKNNLLFEGTVSKRSFIMMLKSIGDMQLPCGSPFCSENVSEYSERNRIWKRRSPVRNPTK